MSTKKAPAKRRPGSEPTPPAGARARKPAAKKRASKKKAAAKRPAVRGRPPETGTSVPTFERPPLGLDAYWLGVWRTALKVMKDQKTWKVEQRPLLDEYVFALIAAENCRVGFGWLDHLTEVVAAEEIQWNILAKIAGALPTNWDRHVKRAAALAKELYLTPEAQARLVPRPAKPAATPPIAPPAKPAASASYFGPHLVAVE